MTTATELKARILRKAEDDGEFRARLIADPKAAISAETGTTIPDGFDIVVHEDSATTAHLVLPPSGELSEAEMESAAGGMGIIVW
ncbi:MAG: NHLP leader peptide family RiPP precursor [Deltaproteobacteria bacterium]|nr:NHLP leader peptide family RiPP precursor [Deltaproteobacteria bacterium]